jgi:hypothetical protein
MADAESAVVLDAHLGGQPVVVIGFESRPLPRRGLSHASVIGGAPAAAVVFAAEVNKRPSADPRVAGLRSYLIDAVRRGMRRSRT